MPRPRYDALTQSLHWIVALLIVTIYAIGYGREFLPKGDLKAGLLALHISLGLAYLLLVGARVFWRLTATPMEPVPMSRPAHAAARAAHMGLYAMMILVPVIGLVAAYIKGRTVGFFGLPLPNLFVVDVPFGKLLEGMHGWAAHGMMALVGLHSGAALAHHYLLKDGLLLRMLPEKMKQLSMVR